MAWQWLIGGGTNQGAELAEISRVAMYLQVMSSLYFVASDRGAPPKF